jgi:hypothetical protein
MLQDLGSIGDFVGGIAVVISLVYLAFQIRRSTLAIRAAMIQAASHHMSEILEMMVRDAEVFRLFQAGTHDFESLSEQDQQRFSLFMGAVLSGFENVVAQTEHGVLPREWWVGAANRLRGTFALPGTLQWWARGKHAFNVQLQSWIDRAVIGK